MACSIKPLKCSGHCSNCYENGIRKNYQKTPNLKLMTATLKKEIKRVKETRANTPGLHGGEPLFLPIKTLNKFMKMIYKEFGKTNIQTDGLMITAKHITLFKKYKTYVGISIDGDTGELNRGRWDAEGITQEQADKNTQIVMKIIKRLKEEGLQVGIISILRKCNAGTPEKVNKLLKFYDRLQKMGIQWIRTNPVIAYDKPEDQLTNKQLAKAWRMITDYYLQNPSFKPYPSVDFLKTASGNFRVVCFMTDCDPFRTAAENTISEDGSLGNCLKTGSGKDGMVALRAEKPSNLRSEILQGISQEENGCQGCEYWNRCKGGCPGAGIDDDWRNRTRFCEAYKEIFKYTENLIKAIGPITEEGARIKSAAPSNSNGKRPPNRSHGDGYADSNRPWTLKDPHNNRVKPINYNGNRRAK